MSASAFNPLRAAREELAGLNDVYRVLIQREHRAEEAMASAEQELNALRKILGYVRITMDVLKQRIAELEQQHER
jgi:phage shock protein A